MKNRLILLTAVLAAVILTGSACAGAAPAAEAPENPVIRLSTTTSVNDSGLLSYLQETFESDTGYTLEVISNGTGAAIKLGESGDADVLLVHAKASEEEFVKAGFGIERIPFMYNYFVIVGPESDPAGILGAASAKDAFSAIAKGGLFVSRGDDSGTNKAELKLWEAAGIDPAKESWYISAGKGMGACLLQAAENEAYCLTDKATFLSMESKGDLKILLGESDDMKNTYSMIAVNPDKNAGVNIDGANAFIEWMLGAKAQGMIKEYGSKEYGEPLFFLIEK
jgi:tungstate transport system substrate-binding protein